MQYVAKVPVALRLDEALVARMKSRAEELGQSQTVFVTRALEKALGSEGGGGSPGVSKPVLPASPRASAPFPSKCARCGRETLDRDSMDYTGAQSVCAGGCGEDYEREPFYE